MCRALFLSYLLISALLARKFPRFTPNQTCSGLVGHLTPDYLRVAATRTVG